MAATAQKTTRLEARISPDVLAAVKRAAEMAGRSVSDFVVDAAYRAAKDAIAENHVIQLSLADQERVAEIMSRPPKPSPALDRARAAYDQLIISSE